MAEQEVTICLRGSINLSDFGCDSIEEFQELLDDNGNLYVELEAITGETLSSYISYPLVEEED